jgi:putative CocE/NonD family hydrolase
MEPLYLHVDGKLSLSQPEEEHAYRSYLSDPAHPVPYTADIQNYRNREYMASDQRFASARPDVLTYTSDVLQDTLRLGGPLDVELQTAISSTDADFVVKLIDVYPDGFTYPGEIRDQLPVRDYPMGGYQMLVRGDIMRGKFRDGFDREVPFTPDKITRVTFRMNDIAHTFLPGHRLMVQVQSSCFPLFDRNPQTFTNIYTCGESAFKPCTVRIYTDKDHASCIMIPVLKGKI